MRERSILAVQYTPVTPRVQKDVRGFLNYIRERDVHPSDGDQRLEGLIRYVANRDHSAVRGLLFGAEGSAGELDSKHFTAYVRRSIRDWKPQLYRDRDGTMVDARRAVSRFVLSPENAEGLDLQQLTRAVLRQLELDAGGLPPWIAAEHRNTAHRHVHLVLASRREVSPGRFRTVKITRERLERMKQAMLREIERQRERELTPVRSRSLGWLAELERETGPLSERAWATARRARLAYSAPPPPAEPSQAREPQLEATRPVEPVVVRLSSRTEPRTRSRSLAHLHPSAATLRLRLVAQRYRREAELEAERWRREREREQEWER